MSRKRARPEPWLGQAKAAKRKRDKTRPYGEWDNELKYNDTEVFDSTITGSTSWTGCEQDPVGADQLAKISQGAAATNRIGRKTVLKSIALGGTVLFLPTTGQTAPLTPGSVLIALVLDTQTNGSQMSSESVYESFDLYAATAPRRVMANISRFKVLKKILIEFPQPTAVLKGLNMYDIFGCAKTFQMNVQLNIPVAYLDDSFGIDDVSDNSLHLIVNRDRTDGTMQITYNSRVRFVG